MVWRLLQGAWLVLVLLSWWTPPYISAVPLAAALVWSCGGVFLVLWRWWVDRPGRWYWGIQGLVWLVSLSFTWRLWPHSPAPRHAFRVASWNMDAAHYDRRQIEKDLYFIRSIRADIFCLQEVYLGDYSPETFAKKAGFSHHVFLKAGGARGMLILSRYPLAMMEEPLLVRGSTNGIMAARFYLPNGRSGIVVNIHYPSYRLANWRRWRYSWWKAVWAQQRRFDAKLQRLIADYRRDPLFLCGDFNAVPWSHIWWRLVRWGLWDSFWAGSWLRGPTWRPIPLRIDYLWSTSLDPYQETLWQSRQDHACLVAAYPIEKVFTFADKSGR